MSYFNFSEYHKNALLYVEIFALEKFDISREKLYSPTRDEESAYARFIVWYLLRKVYHFSLPMLGDIFKRDHTTVFAGVKRVDTEHLGDEVLRQFYEKYPGMRPKVLPGPSPASPQLPPRLSPSYPQAEARLYRLKYRQ